MILINHLLFVANIHCVNVFNDDINDPLLQILSTGDIEYDINESTFSGLRA